MADNDKNTNTIQNIIIDTALGTALGENAGQIATDVLLDELIDSLVAHYTQAKTEVEKKTNDYFKKFTAEDKKKRNDLIDGKITKSQYQAWQRSKVFSGKRWVDLQNTLAQDLTNTNEIAASIINNKKCDVYALNRNYGTYEIERRTGISTSFVLYDHDTVERLIAEKPDILPLNKIDIPRNKKWNMQNLRNATTQGILQGESIPQIAKRMQDVTDMDKSSAIKNARTATTGAQSAGRVNSYERAKNMGINTLQVWISTLDARTRHTHRLMMGERQEVGKKFSNGCRFPGDPQGPLQEIYNCRCTIVAQVKGYEYDVVEKFKNKITKNGETFAEWQSRHSFPKHYNESVKSWMNRYSEHLKNVSFKDWLEEQAMPDELITKNWGNMGWSKLFYEIYDKSHTDANLFKKELTALSKQMDVKPKDIWDKYLTGQLDAEQLSKFEGIIKKYLPNNATTKVDDIISNNFIIDKDNATPFAEKVGEHFNKLGYNQPAKFVSDVDFDKLDGPVFYRGISGDYTVDDFVNSKRFIGKGNSGYGTNFSTDIKTAEGFKENGTLITAKFKPDAKIISDEDLMPFVQKAYKDAENLTGDAYKLATNPSTVAADLGYDAIYSKDLGWYNVLNREALIVKSDNIIDAVKTAEKAPSIHPNAQKALDDIKWEKIEPMDFDKADNYHVNPNYKGNKGEFSVNCQTSTFAYECRRQGYDVIALGNKKGADEISKLQYELATGTGQSKGWINKVTGEPPKMLYGGNPKFENIDNVVGHNGERYSIGVKWKSGGAHVINMDRDSDGILRLIDNQRGPGEKHIWKGEKEIKEYLDRVSSVNRIYRLDDCVPNPKFLNKIVEKANTPAASISKTKVSVSNFAMPTSKNIDTTNKILDPSKKQLYKSWLGQYDLDPKDVANAGGWEAFKQKYTKYPDSWKVKIDSFFIDDPAKTTKVTNNAVSEMVQKGHVGLSGKESDDFIEKYHNKKQIKLSNGTSNTMNGKLSHDVNDALRKGDKITDPKINDTIEKLNKGINANTLPQDMTLFRGANLQEFDDLDVFKGYVPKKVSMDDFKLPNGQVDYDEWSKAFEKAEKENLEELRKRAEGAIGKTHYNAGYTTVSASSERNAFLFSDVNVQIRTKAGTNAYISNYKDESEIILKRNSGLKVVGADIAEVTAENGSKARRLQLICEYSDDIKGISKTVTNVTDVPIAKPTPTPEIAALDTAAFEKKSMSAVFTDIKSTDTKTANKFYKELQSQGKPSEVWNKYLKGELDPANAKKIDDILVKKYSALEEAMPGESVTGLDIDLLKQKKVTGVYNDFVNDGNKTTANKFYNELKKIGAKDGIKQGDVWKKYLNGELDFEDIEKIDKYVIQKYSKTTTAGPNFTMTKSDLPDDYHVVQHDVFDKFVDFADKNYMALDHDILYMSYKKGAIDDPELDKIFNIKSGSLAPKAPKENIDDIAKKIKTEAYKIDPDLSYDDGVWKQVAKVVQDKNISDPAKFFEDWVNDDLKDPDIAMKVDNIFYAADTKPSGTSVSTVDLSQLQGKKVMDIYHELETEKIHNKFYNELKKIGKPSDIWSKYLGGELNVENTEKINKYIEKLYPKTTAATKIVDGSNLSKSTPDFSNYKKKSMSDVLNNEMKPNGQYSAFYKTLKEISDDANLGSQSKAWKAWQDGKLSEADAKKIEKFLNGGNTTTSVKVASTLSPEQQKKLDNAKQILNDTKQKLEDAKKNLPKNKTYSGIWKNDVTLADYESKKDKIAAKKIYYEDEITILEAMKSGNPSNFSSYSQHTLDKYKQYLKDLDEFEKLGPTYAKYQKEVDKAQAAVKTAQNEVNKLSPASEMYTQERKDAAVWAKNKGSDYMRVDKVFDPNDTLLKDDKALNPTHKEMHAYMDYTSASGPYNKPLVGFDSPDGSGASGWTEQYWVGPGKLDIDKRGRGNDIRALTTLTEKSTFNFDFWMQTSQNFATLEGKEGFLGIPYGTLQNLTDGELQQFVGTAAEFPQFISGSINKGGGSYNPGNMRINIYVPQGSEALYVRKDGTFGKNEHEMILQRGGTYKITKMYWGEDEINGGKRLIVDMELRLEYGYNKFQQ